MATTKGENKSKAIRDFMRKNRGATVPQIVAGLEADGVTVTATLVYNVRANAAKKKARTNAAKATASDNGAAGPTKADQIREVAKGMNKPIRPVDVVAVLKARGVEVLRTQVSQVLAKMGLRRKHRGRRKAAASRLAGGGLRGAAPAAADSLNIDDLVLAKKLVAQVGSIEKVREALAALARLG